MTTKGGTLKTNQSKKSSFMKVIETGCFDTADALRNFSEGIENVAGRCTIQPVIVLNV